MLTLSFNSLKGYQLQFISARLKGYPQEYCKPVVTCCKGTEKFDTEKIRERIISYLYKLEYSTPLSVREYIHNLIITGIPFQYSPTIELTNK